MGFADALVGSQEELLERVGLSGAEVVTLTTNWGERFVRLLNNPGVAGLLMTIIFFGIIAEVQTAVATMGLAAVVLARRRAN